jgi:hypothetical protein
MGTGSVGVAAGNTLKGRCLSDMRLTTAIAYRFTVAAIPP